MIKLNELTSLQMRVMALESLWIDYGLGEFLKKGQK